MPLPKLETLPEEGFIREAQLIPHILPISASTLARLIEDGQFPKPVVLSARVRAFSVREVRAWMDQRMQQREAPDEEV